MASNTGGETIDALSDEDKELLEKIFSAYGIDNCKIQNLKSKIFGISGKFSEARSLYNNSLRSINDLNNTIGEQSMRITGLDDEKRNLSNENKESVEKNLVLKAEMKIMEKKVIKLKENSRELKLKKDTDTMKPEQSKQPFTTITSAQNVSVNHYNNQNDDYKVKYERTLEELKDAMKEIDNQKKTIADLDDKKTALQLRITVLESARPDLDSYPVAETVSMTP